MDEVLIYSTHNYTASIASRIRKMQLGFVEAFSEDYLLQLVSERRFGLIVLDSSSERRIFELVEKLDECDANLVTSVLFLIPGKISYEENFVGAKQRTVLGVSKPFSPGEFTNVARFLLRKTNQHQKIAASYEELEHFTVMASHDLKTPVQNVRAYADIVLEELDEAGLQQSAKVIEYVNVIKSESKRMIEFVDDMFEFSKAGALQFSNQTIQLPGLVHSIYADIRGRHPDREVSLNLVDLPAEFYADPEKLSPIFRNLIENAIKYSAEDQPLCIDVGYIGTTGSEACFYVEDNGSGIKKEDLEKIFLPFRRGRTNVKGTGIGLAIVKKLVELYNGRIWAETELDQGSKFVFTLVQSNRETENEVA